MNEPLHPPHAPDCLKCLHFSVTWNARFPRGCRMFGIKCRELPSREVFLSTGKHCPAFRKSPRIKEAHRQDS